MSFGSFLDVFLKMFLRCVWNIFWIALRLLDGHKKYQEIGFESDCGKKIWREICFEKNAYRKKLEFHCHISKMMNQWVFSNRLWKKHLEIFIHLNINVMNIS